MIKSKLVTHSQCFIAVVVLYVKLQSTSAIKTKTVDLIIEFENGKCCFLETKSDGGISIQYIALNWLCSLAAVPPLYSEFMTEVMRKCANV